MPQSTFTHRKPRSWQKIAITVPEKYSDTVASFLADLNNSAVEQSTIISQKDSIPEDVVSVYLEENTQLTAFKKQIQDFLNTLNEQQNFTFTLNSELVVEEDWNKNWKDHFKAFNLTKRLVVKPSWEEYTPCDNEVVLEMDPGMAFGTGLHDSTRLALLLIEDLFKKKQIQSVLDVGTGTGILGMSCALFGADEIIGLDNDIDARVASAENICQNHLEKKMSIIDKDLSQISQKFDLVIANITQNVLTLLADSLTASVKPGGSLILSGILNGEQAQDIQQTFNNAGLTTHTTKQSDEWTALHFTAPAQ